MNQNGHPEAALRIGVVWDARTQWLGGWNYFLNMLRVTGAFAPGLHFVLFSSPDLPANFVQQARDAGAETVLTLAPFRRFTHPRVLLFGGHAGLNAALTRAKIDLVFEMTNYLGALAVPVVSWIPDAQHWILPHLFSRRERLQRDLEFRRRLTRRPYVMLSSQAALRDIQAFMPRPFARLAVVPFTVRPTLAVDDAAIAAAQARYNLSPGYLCLPNQFWQHKNHLLALEGLVRAVQDGADIRLVLSGQALDSRAGDHPAKLGAVLSTLQERVRMLNVIPYPDLLALIAGSRALLNPSLFEGWSTTVEEAKALGTRMVLSDLAVHREQAGEQAIFFDRHNAQDCARALTETARLPLMVDSAARAEAVRANLAAQQTYAQRLERLFREVLA